MERCFSLGDQLVLFEAGESFVGPDTGEVLGSEETELGTVQITESEARFSKARVFGEPVEVRAGSIPKSAQFTGNNQGRERSGARM